MALRSCITVGEVLEIGCHTATGHLEYSQRFSACKKLVDLLVIERDALKIDMSADSLLNTRDGVGEHREVGKPQNVEFEETNAAVLIGDRLHIVLRYRFSTFWIELYR